jgi:hypothetical protein
MIWLSLGLRATPAPLGAGSDRGHRLRGSVPGEGSRRGGSVHLLLLVALWRLRREFARATRDDQARSCAPGFGSGVSSRFSVAGVRRPRVVDRLDDALLILLFGFARSGDPWLWFKAMKEVAPPRAWRTGAPAGLRAGERRDSQPLFACGDETIFFSPAADFVHRAA